jgi:integrase
MEGLGTMAKNVFRSATALHLLNPRGVLAAGIGGHSDGGGLWLRIAGKSAAWVFRYTAPTGKRREMGLGVVHRGSPQQAGASLTGARDAAHRARELLRAGVDPIDAREKHREAQRAAEVASQVERARERWTLARCSRDYHERVIEPNRTTKHGAQWIASLENHVPAPVWNKPIGDIKAPELLGALLAIKPHERARRHDSDKLPETLRRIRQRLDSVFEDAIFHGRCTGNPAAAIKRKLREAMPKETPGEFAALPYREAPAFMQRLRDAHGTAARCLELAVLTAARTGEVLGAVWSEFDLDAATWVIPALRMKAGEEHMVPLSPRAIELLQLQRKLNLDPRIVFPSPIAAGKPLSNMSMLSVLDRMGLRDKTTVHGLCRSTFSTWANETGAARPDVIEACLAHNERDKVRAAYCRAQFHDERRALLAAWAEYLETPAAQVVPLRAA